MGECVKTSVAVMLLLSGTIAAAGCGSESGPDQEPGPGPTQAYRVTSGRASSFVPDPDHTVLELDLIVTTAAGSRVPGAVVRLQATGGTLAATQLTANSNGVAEAVWTLPLPTVESYSLSACATSPADAPCTYAPVWEIE